MGKAIWERGGPERVRGEGDSDTATATRRRVKIVRLSQVGYNSTWLRVATGNEYEKCYLRSLSNQCPSLDPSR